MSEFNVLIDILPKDYEGYLINYQYYNGILINECLSDREHIFENKEDKIYTALTILFGKGIPPIDIAMQGLNWFLSCGKEDFLEHENGKRSFCFTQDSEYIYSAFRLKFGINLAKEKDLHWFEFLYLFNDLSKTAFSNIVGIRTMKSSELKNYSKEACREILAQKKKFALKDEPIYSEETKQKIDSFYDKFGL